MNKISRFYFNMLLYRTLSLVHGGRRKLHYKNKYIKMREIFNKVLMEYGQSVSSGDSSNINNATQLFEERLVSIERFINQQIPSMLESNSQMNSRLVDLEKSVPVALRHLARMRK